jgi:hypothetical protein
VVRVQLTGGRATMITARRRGGIDASRGYPPQVNTS